MPIVSVVIPTHNRARLVRRSLRSVLQQTYRDLEVIVIDDGSTDDTQKQIATFLNDARVRYIYQNNRGLAAARNRGICASQGSYVAFLDDDDLWLPDKLENQVHLLETNDHVSAVHCDFRFVDTNGNILPIRYRRPASRGSIYEDLMFDNVITGSGSGVLVRRQCLTEVGLFDENLGACEDQDLWRRIALVHDFGYIDEVLLYILWHRRSMHMDAERMAAAKLRYLDKLCLEAPPRFRHHLPGVAYHIYADAAFSFLRANDFDNAKPFVLRIAKRGPRYLYRFALVLGLRAARYGPLASMRSYLLRPRKEDGNKEWYAVGLTLRLVRELFRKYRHRDSTVFVII